MIVLHHIILEMHDGLRQPLFSAYDHRDNRGIIMTITVMTFLLSPNTTVYVSGLTFLSQ